MRQSNIAACYPSTAVVNQGREKANAFDNAMAESFFSGFKAESVENGVFAAVEEARSEVFGDI